MSIRDYAYTPSDRLLPDPEPRPADYTIISVDDHLVEPPWLFEGRLPAKFQDDAPKIVETPEGHQQWHFDGKVFAQMGFNALVGRVDRDDFTFEPARFDDMRRGCFDIHARVRDMDIVGVWASICFPSQITGFCGRIYSDARDPELGYARRPCVQRLDQRRMVGFVPERIVPMGITFLRDPQKAADEIRRNAARGFVAVSLPEQPYMAGLPSIHDHEYWDPILRACVETDTVICLHIGSSGQLLPRDPAAPPGVGSGATLFQVQSLVSCCEWLWAGVPTRYPSIKIAMSEGGIGWVPMVMDRLDFMMSQSGHGRTVWKQMAGACCPPRSSAATSGSAPSTTRRRSRCANASASITSCSNATTRTPTRRGPTRRSSRDEPWASCRPTRSPRSRTRTRRSCSATPYLPAERRAASCNRSTHGVSVTGAIEFGELGAPG